MTAVPCLLLSQVSIFQFLSLIYWGLRCRIYEYTPADSGRCSNLTKVNHTTEGLHFLFSREEILQCHSQ